jgi:ankyrin repeat protein
LLLENGANPNAFTDEGVTPVHLAAQEGVLSLFLLFVCLNM